LQKAPAVNSVFYPFSGPDATNPLAFFPDAADYVLVGLEPAGCIPSKVEDFTPRILARSPPGLAKPPLRWASFKTENMQRDLSEGPASGVLPCCCS